jgi:hypothetical protein
VRLGSGSRSVVDSIRINRIRGKIACPYLSCTSNLTTVNKGT